MNPRSLMRAMVILTALLCLGTAGHAGQEWWAQQIASQLVHSELAYGIADHPFEYIQYWRTFPWYGRYQDVYFVYHNLKIQRPSPKGEGLRKVGPEADRAIPIQALIAP